MNRRLIAHSPLLSTLVLASLAGAIALTAGGCESTKKSDADASAEAIRKADAQTEATVQKLDREFVVGPTAADQLNYRIAWQYAGEGRTPVKATAARGDSVYTLDGQNILTRININDGQRRWRIQVADAVLNVGSLNAIGDHLYITAGSEMLVLEAANGNHVAKWRLERVAGTHPVAFGNDLIYGSRGGDLVWINRKLGFLSKAYHVTATFRVGPVLREHVLAAVGVEGEVIVLNAETASQYWSKRLLNPAVSKPVIGDDMLYVAATDQYLWAFELATGRTAWKVLCEAPLISSPTLVADRIYQLIPGNGLSCFNAIPVDLPGGELLWSNDKVTGNVILERRGDLFAWDTETKRMMVLDARRGSTKTRLDLPQADYLFTGGEKNEDLFAASKDGRVVRLVPRN